MFRRFVMVSALVLVAACGKKEQPAVTPTPVEAGGSVVNNDAANQQRIRDSIAAAEAARAAAVAAETLRAELVNELAATVHFDYDQYSIRLVDEALLTRKAAIMRANPNLRIRVVGHADERGSDEYNLALGMRRAVAAKDFLTRIGVEAGRIETASLGEEVPVDVGSNETAWAANRRAEFDVVAGGQMLVAPRN
ncbi:MAG TPA: OmpA family protein [Gemmatimonadales bacterium]|nr:OmpA family protein [Gemmatimonadales bacterium]